MLQKLRDQTQNTGFKVLVVAIILVLTLFGFGATNLFLAGNPDIAQVGDYDITQNVLAVETERERRRILAQLGPEFDPSTLDPLQLQERALQQLISRQVMYQTAAELGVVTPRETVDQTLLDVPQYQLNGVFDEALYRQQVQMMNYTPAGFHAEITNELSSSQLQQGILNSRSLMDWELAELVRVVNQQRDIAYLPLTVENFKAGIEVSDNEVALRYEEEQSAYMTPLKVDVSYVRLGVDDLLDDPSIEVFDEDLQQLYEEERQGALADEQRDSSHILVQVNNDRSEEQALSLITEIQTRLNGGEVFEDLAKELSEDPGSAADGGSLGPVGKNVFDPAFEAALFALENPGDLSAPVLSAFGYHLIRLDEFVVPEYPDFESQRGELEIKVRRAQATDLFVDKALELERSVYDERTSLDASAADAGLEIVQVAGISQDAPGDDLLFNQPAALDAVFSARVLDGRNSDPIELGEDQVAYVRVDAQYPPEPIPLEEVAADIRAAIEREKALAAIDVAQAQALERLRAGDSTVDVAEANNAEWQTFEAANRGGNPAIPQQVLTAAFDLPRPASGEKAVGIADLPDGAAVVTVTRVVPGDVATTTDADLAELRRVASGRVSRLDIQSLFEAAEESIGVKRFIESG